MPYKYNPISGQMDFYEASSGDVTGPASSTDNAIARYDGTTGKLLQDSGVLIDDTDNVTGVTSLTADDGAAATPSINFATDQTTGFYLRAAGELGFATDGNEVAFFDAAGDLSLAQALRETQGGTGATSYATGDILYASASNTLSKLSAGSDNEVLTLASGVPSWAAAAGGLSSLKNTPEFFEDFVWQGSTSLGFGENNWINNNSSGAISFVSGVAGHPGIVRLESTNGATDRSELVINASSFPIFFGDGIYTIEWLVRLTRLSDATDDYRVGIGFNGSIGGAPANGCLFTYNHAVNSGNWTIECDDGAGTTTADSGTAVAAGTWYRLGIVVNAAATSVAFYINGTETTNSPLTTNIPDGASEYTQPHTYIKNLAGTAADRYLDHDYCYMKIELTSARA